MGENQTKYEKGKDGSYLHNCYMERREGDVSPWMFHCDGDTGSVIAALNGYAIIPMERYAKLVGKDYDEKAICDADEQLRRG